MARVDVGWGTPGFIAGESTNQCVAGGVMEMKQVPGTPEATAMDLV